MRYLVGRDYDAERVYRAEANLEKQLPTGTLTIEAAQLWIERIAFAEDIDPPQVMHASLSHKLVGLAFTDYKTIVVGSIHPTRLTLLHELAHFLGTGGHSLRFQDDLVRLVRIHLSHNQAEFLDSQFRVLFLPQSTVDC